MKSNKVQKLYANRAAFYDRFFVDFLGWGKQLVAFFRSAAFLQPGIKILDAGCGTGVITRVLYQLAQQGNVERIIFHAFDLTQAMLDVFQHWINEHVVSSIELAQADVLEIEQLPSHWRHYDLIVTSTMLEYLPRPNVQAAIGNLKALLGENGILLVFITKRTPLTQWLAARWWKTTLYDEHEIQTLLHDAGFKNITFKSFASMWSSYIIVVEAKL